jgi:acetoin utilization protein AcuC
MRRLLLIASPDLWSTGHGADHPLKPERLRRTYELLDEYGALQAPNVRLAQPRPATDEELALFHTPDYIDAVRRLSAGDPGVDAGGYGFGPGDNPVFPGMDEVERLKVGGALVGAEALLRGDCDVAFHFAGGMHHAWRNEASGFCVYNDPVVAIEWLRRQGHRVAYVDVDVHHGDGVQFAFYDTDQVLTISLHQDGRTLFPGTGAVDEIGRGAGEGFSVNVPLPPYTGDEDYLWAFDQVVPPLLARFKPDLLVTQLGVDTHALDPLAQLRLTTHGQSTVFQSLARLAPSRWLALGGGGYELDVVPRAWALAFAAMGGLTLPDELPPHYRDRYGSERLHDRAVPWVDETIAERVHDRVEDVVGKVKALHGLA